MRQGYFKKVGLVCITGLFLFSFFTAALAQEEEEEIIAVMREVSGEVGAISPGLITVIYNRDEDMKREDEIDLPIDKDVRLVHKSKLSDINIGDIVSVKYEELQKKEEIEKEGITETKTRIIGRKAKVITFVRPKREY